MAVIETATPGTTTYGRPVIASGNNKVELFLTQLETIQAGWDADAPAGLYDISYSATTQRVSVETTNAVDHRPQMPANSALWFGFSQDLSAGAGFSDAWQADDPPAGLVELFAVEVSPALDAARVDLGKYRHGRAVATVWGNRQAHMVRLYFRSSAKDQIEAGFVTSGRVRIWQCGDGTAYSPTNVDGFIDGWVLASDNIKEDGDVGGLWSIDMVVGVTR